jgi:hypothetical protein
MKMPGDIEIIRDTAKITIKRKHFNLKIEYKQSKYKKSDLLSPSLLIKVSKKLSRIPINPIYAGDDFFKILINIKWKVYRIELHGDTKPSTRIHSLLGDDAKDLEWLDLVVGSFNDFFDIDKYVTKVEETNMMDSEELNQVPGQRDSKNR